MIKRVGQIGLGIMGSAFARNMMRNGLKIVGYDIDPAKMAEIDGGGFEPATSPEDVAQQVDVVITSLPSAQAFHTVMTGENSIKSSGRSGLIVVDACTLTIDDKQKAHDDLASEDIILLDCPVSGTGAQAAKGDLVLLGSGDREAFDRVRDILQAFNREVRYIGPFGDGSKMKFAANILVAIHNVSAAEAMVFGMKAGLEPQLLYEVLSQGAGNSRVFELRAPMMVANDYETNKSAAMTIQDKDMRVIADYAEQIKCPTPLFAASAGFYRAALHKGLEQSDTASVCAILEELAGVTRD